MSPDSGQGLCKAIQLPSTDRQEMDEHARQCPIQYNMEDIQYLYCSYCNGKVVM